MGANFTIISINCFGGRIYQDLKLPYTSPTAGLFFFFDDYVEFVENFDDYIKRDIKIIEKSKWDTGEDNVKKYTFDYPIGQIVGTSIEVHFLHYDSADEAISKWYRRRDRITNNKIFIAFNQNLPNFESAERFLKLPRTILFSTVPMPKFSNCIYIKELKNYTEAPDPYVYSRTYYKHLAKYFKSIQK